MTLFWIAVGWNVIPAARSHDFLNLYTGASLAREGRFADLHNRQAQLERERELVPSTPMLIPFVRPHFYAAFLAPLSLLGYDTALHAWLVLQVLLLMACWAWGYRTFGPDALIFGPLYLPTALGIAHGQDGVFMLLAVIGSYHFAQREQPLKSGATLALGLMKFHLLLLAPVAMLIEKRWKMLQGFCAVATAEVLASLALGGTQAVSQYASLLRAKDLERLSPSPELMINLYSIGINFGIDSIFLAAGLALAAVVLLVMGVRRAPLWRFFTVWTVGSLLIAPHVFGYDAALLLLPLWLALFCSKSVPTRIAATFLVTPIPYAGSLLDSPWAALPALSLLLFLAALAREGYKESDGALAAG